MNKDTSSHSVPVDSGRLASGKDACSSDVTFSCRKVLLRTGSENAAARFLLVMFPTLREADAYHDAVSARGM